MKLCVVSFTKNGIELSQKIAKMVRVEEISTFTKCSYAKKEQHMVAVNFIEESIGDWTRKQMQEKNALLFIGACGIAVRAIAPCITDKLSDSPVLVMDEYGNHIIPILAGHIGGANELANEIAGAIGAIPVITTATDLNEKFAVDLFAKKNHLFIVNKEGIAKVSRKVLQGEIITMSIQEGHWKEHAIVPENIQMIPYPPSETVDVLITEEQRRDKALLYLKPKEYVIGMGCKKGKEIEKIEDYISRSVKEAGICLTQIAILASIDQKREEAGLITWSRKQRIPFETFSAEQLQKIEGNFHVSEFVKEQVGVDNVCERAALCACGTNGRLVYEKHAKDGMTIAIAKRYWRVSFDGE